MFNRKVIAASFTVTIYSIIFLIFVAPDDFGSNITTDINDLATNFRYLVPVVALFIFSYGLLASLGIEALANLMLKIPDFSLKTRHIMRHFLSLLLHLGFGMVLFIFSLVASFIFYICDFCLQLTNKKFSYKHALISLIFPLTLWLLALVISIYYT